MTTDSLDSNILVDLISIRLASPDDIRTWSHGEVKKPETISFRTMKPERDGLFCEKIFGPEKNWECQCGRYKGQRYRDLTCEKCQVTVTESRERRRRMGHINLAVPVVHIWFWKVHPSRLGAILNLRQTDLEQVIYYRKFIVTNVKYVITSVKYVVTEVSGTGSGLKKNQLITEAEYKKLKAQHTFSAERAIDIKEKQLVDEEGLRKLREYSKEKYGEDAFSFERVGGLKEKQLLEEDEYKKLKEQYKDGFTAEMGAEALLSLLKKVNIKEEASRLRKEIVSEKIKVDSPKHKELFRRLQIIEKFIESGNKPENMILRVLPVIPPELRPLLSPNSALPGAVISSDLNELYRRVINRNNRLNKLFELGAPELIIRNEKKLLQEAVDYLLDNSRSRKPALSNQGRPLKSLTDTIKGKQGRFRENLLGKRVDYSARSVIVVGPELKLHQCGLPKTIALELYQPFIVAKLKQLGIVDSVPNARELIERKDDRIWDILDDIIKNHPLLLNRAPTLHRVSIQAFQPVLIEGASIQLHPLVCPPFNADFDGDQMSVHLPLSLEAQIEASTLMMSSENIFSSANGNPLTMPSQDIVLGLAYLTTRLDHLAERRGGKVQLFENPTNAIAAYDSGLVQLNEPIIVKVRGRNVVSKEKPKDRPKYAENLEKLLRNEKVLTTAGRCLFNEILPPGTSFYNCIIDKKQISEVVKEVARVVGRVQVARYLDAIKELGFKWATLAGVSLSKDDMKIPPEKKQVIQWAKNEVEKIEEQAKKGVITQGERKSKIIDVWMKAREVITKHMETAMENDERKTEKGEKERVINPLWLMVSTGARGNKDQVRQLAGIRGLMAKPGGEIIETPILSNFREGLGTLEYFISSHGGRKGLVDTALKTSDAGYLTRKLVDVAQNVIIVSHDCGTLGGVPKKAIKQPGIDVPLWQLIYGRTARNDLVATVLTIKRPDGRLEQQIDVKLVSENELIAEDIAKIIERRPYDKDDPDTHVEEDVLLNIDGELKRVKVVGGAGFTEVQVRSPLTCQAGTGVCALCYGMDLSTGKLVELGAAVGIVAAQSVGEPGTQLTLRTFHIGGVAVKAEKEAELHSKYDGVVKFFNIKSVKLNENETIVSNRSGQIIIQDDAGREKEAIPVPGGTKLKVKEGQKVRRGELLGEYDVHSEPIIAGFDGYMVFEGGEKGKSYVVERDERRGIDRIKITNSTIQVKQKQADGIEKNVWKTVGIKIYSESDWTDQKDIDHPLQFLTLRPNTYIEQPEGYKGNIENWVLGKAPPIKVKAGTTIAKTEREAAASQDITAGLPRVTELFEARKPKDPAIMAKIPGKVLIEKKRQRTILTIVNKSGGRTLKHPHEIPAGKSLRVDQDDEVNKGDQLVEGTLNPRELLDIKGPDAVQQYLLQEIQNVYRSQGVGINDKHIEIIIAQMFRKVRIVDAGDSKFLRGAVVDKVKVIEENEKLKKEKKTPATYRPVLLGISRAALQSDSFIAAASFQETPRVLADAAISGKKDALHGIKENVIAGSLIPAGTGFREYLRYDVYAPDLEQAQSQEEAKDAA